MLHSLLRGFWNKICLCYLDNAVVYSSSFAEQVHRLKLIFSCHHQPGSNSTRRNDISHTRISRCYQGPGTLVLCFVASASGISSYPDKQKALTDFPVLKTLKDLRHFTELASYFRRFVRGFAAIAASLAPLPPKNIAFKWGSKLFSGLLSPEAGVYFAACPTT